MANLERFNFDDVPDEKVVMTTWHQKESLQEVFEYSKSWARHKGVELSNTLILHINGTGQADLFTKMLENA